MSTDELPPIIGLTGGIGSGKSTVAKMLRTMGVCVIDADVIAREVVAPGEPALAEICEAFGDDVLDAEGRLDRAALGAVVFSDPDARRRLESITHPRIGQRMIEKAAEAGADGHDFVVYDAALIVENGLQGAFAGLIVVAADEDVRVERVMQRDGVEEGAVRARIAAQMPLEDKLAVADWVVDNGGSLEETRAQVEALLDDIRDRLKTASSPG